MVSKVLDSSGGDSDNLFPRSLSKHRLGSLSRSPVTKLCLKMKQCFPKVKVQKIEEGQIVQYKLENYRDQSSLFRVAEESELTSSLAFKLKNQS